MKTENQLIYESYSDTRDLRTYDLKTNEYYQVVSGKEKEWKGVKWNKFPFNHFSTKTDWNNPVLLVPINTLKFKVGTIERMTTTSNKDGIWIELEILSPDENYMYKSKPPFNFEEEQEGAYVSLNQLHQKLDLKRISILFLFTTKFKQLDDQNPIVMQDLF